jgi:hypothetical protein
MYDTNDRKMVDLEVTSEYYPDYMVVKAYYEDDGSEVPAEELDKLENDIIALYVAGVIK